MRRLLVSVLALAAVMAAPAYADVGRRARGETSPSPIEILSAANHASRQRAASGAFQQARHIFLYEPGALYEIYANPNYVSAILLEPGERLQQIAAGDTSRWLVSEAEAESAGEGRPIVLVKPQAANLRTNIVLITDRRTYLVEAVSTAGSVYSAEVAWTYPHAPEDAPQTIASLNFNYSIRTTRGRTPPWRPTRVFDDGRKTYIEFAPSIAASDLPPLFVITADGAELVNYRVQGHLYQVDRMFDVAELRLGTNAQTIVRIERARSQRTRPIARGRRRP